MLIPVFPGTNCEYDSQRAIEKAGGRGEILVIRNLSPGDIEESLRLFAQKIRKAQMIFIPGGFSGGDEPDGSGKFITAFFRKDLIRREIDSFMENRDGLICGICNGFQALIKLGLVPYGKIVDPENNNPTLTYNIIDRHQSKIVNTRIASNMSPWLSFTRVGEVYSVPVSHGEGRFLANIHQVEALEEKGQIATQYADFSGNASSDVNFNPNGSVGAIEGLTSPDGRVLGKMGHSERVGKYLYKNVEGNYNIQMFESAVHYFKG